MATRDEYEMQTWEDLPSENTPVSAERIGHIEQGIKDASDNRALKEIYDDNAINLGRKEGTTVGNFSTTGGDGTEASGANSHAEGFCTIAKGNAQHVLGVYNIPDSKNRYVIIVGGGSSEEDRNNIFTLDWNGNAVFAGDLQWVFNGVPMSTLALKNEITGRCNAMQSQINALSERVTLLEANQNIGEEGGEAT